MPTVSRSPKTRGSRTAGSGAAPVVPDRGTRRRQAPRAWRGALIALVVLIGCGGGGGSSDSPTSAPVSSPTPSTNPPRPTAPPPGPSPEPRPVAGCVAPAEPARGGELLVDTWIADAFESPVALVQPPGDDNLWYVVGQRGLVWRVATGDGEPKISVALDWRGRTVDPDATGSHEAGLWGLAFHPNYPSDARAFVTATVPAASGCPFVVLEELLVNGDGTFDPTPNRVLFEIRTNCTFVDGVAQSIHHGGTLHFDPSDGRLVYGLGDLNRPSRSPSERWPEGSLLWLDVDTDLTGDPTLPGLLVPGGILANGLRNPWKWSFDRATGEIWAGDVGRDRREEVNRVARGEQYGWPSWEGDLCVRSDCDEVPNLPPVFVYDHGAGCSITGGYVYRGDDIPDLFGAYLFADWCSGLVWALFTDGERVEASLVADLARPISSFGEDHDGELYLVDHRGSLLRVRDFHRADRSGFPARLSETGCVDPDDPTQPAAEMLAYDLNVPFWSDGAEKRRWLAVPEGEHVSVDGEGDLSFPAGTVLMKEFSLGDRRIETRLFMNHGASGWQGYSYAWSGGDAELVGPDGARRALAGLEQEWLFPARRECLRCHTEVAGRTLGPELPQLDRTAGGSAENQIDVLIDAGLLDAAVRNDLPPAFPAHGETPLTEADLSAAARAYLHVNCSMCHRPDGRTLIDIDLRASTPLAETSLCGKNATRVFPEVRDPLRIAPGDPTRSVVWQRILHPEDRRMPPLASLEIDEAGAALIADWILSLDGCPAD